MPLVLSYTDEIAKLCNGQETCSLNQWQTHILWDLDVTYNCKAVIVQKTSPTFPSRTDTVTYQSEPTTDNDRTSTSTKVNETISTSSTDASPKSTSPTPTSTPGNATSNTVESKTGNSSSSERFPVTAVASSLATVIAVLAIFLLGILCIRRRRTNIENTGSTRVQDNSCTISTTVTNSVYDETNTAYSTTQPRGNSGQDYEYAEALIVINPTNENEYNTLNRTAKPITADPNCDHISKQSTSVNETLTTTNEEISNTLIENTNCKGLNDDPNYDHVSKQSSPEDQTYSHIKAGKSDHNQSMYQVHDTDLYSHLKQ